MCASGGSQTTLVPPMYPIAKSVLLLAAASCAMAVPTFGHGRELSLAPRASSPLEPCPSYFEQVELLMTNPGSTLVVYNVRSSPSRRSRDTRLTRSLVEVQRGVEGVLPLLRYELRLAHASRWVWRGNGALC